MASLRINVNACAESVFRLFSLEHAHNLVPRAFPYVVIGKNPGNEVDHIRLWTPLRKMGGPNINISIINNKDKTNNYSNALP